MKKFILVVFIGMVLAINVCGIVSELMNEETKEVNHIEETTVTVYTE